MTALAPLEIDDDAPWVEEPITEHVTTNHTMCDLTSHARDVIQRLYAAAGLGATVGAALADYLQRFQPGEEDA